jgi:hypothetical protein
MRGFCTLSALALLAACHSPGQYGYSRAYSPLDEEQAAAAKAKEYDPVMVQRSPDAWKGKPVSLFGVVKSRAAGPGGTTDLTLSLRRLEPRNLCESDDESSCRVTVADREHGVVHVLAKLEDVDDIGKLSIGAGSLVRVVGVIGDEVSPAEGSAVIRAEYYRHWPRNYYVTTADRTHLRR